MLVWEKLNDEFIKKGGGGSVHGVPGVPSSVMTEQQLHHDGAPVPMTTPGCQMEGSAAGKWWRSGTYGDLAVPFLCKGASDMAAAPVFPLSFLSSFLLLLLLCPLVSSRQSRLLLFSSLRSFSSSVPAVPMCVCYARMCQSGCCCRSCSLLFCREERMDASMFECVWERGELMQVWAVRSNGQRSSDRKEVKRCRWRENAAEWQESNSVFCWIMKGVANPPHSLLPSYTSGIGRLSGMDFTPHSDPDPGDPGVENGSSNGQIISNWTFFCT